MAASRARPHILRQQADVGLLLQLQTQDVDICESPSGKGAWVSAEPAATRVEVDSSWSSAVTTDAPQTFWQQTEVGLLLQLHAGEQSGTTGLIVSNGKLKGVSNLAFAAESSS